MRYFILISIFVLALGLSSGFAQKIRFVDTPDEQGYRKGKERFGVWKFYEKGKLVLEYDYDLERVIFQQSIEDKSYYCNNGNNWIPVAKLEVYPRYRGSYLHFYKELYKALKYPQTAIDNHVEGISYLSFDVDEEGKAVNPEVLYGLGYGSEKAILKAFSKIKDHWIPATYEGEVMSTKFVLPVVFSFLTHPSSVPIPQDLPAASLLDGVNVTLFSNSLTKFRLK